MISVYYGKEGRKHFALLDKFKQQWLVYGIISIAMAIKQVSNMFQTTHRFDVVSNTVSIYNIGAPKKRNN